MHFILSILLLLSQQIATPQSSGVVSGIVVDASGGAIVGSQVLIKDSTGAIRQRGSTNTDGAFTFSGIGGGHYDIEVEKASFETAHMPLDVVAGTTPQPLRVKLSVVSKSEVFVVAAPKVDERPTGQLLTTIDESIVQNTNGFSVAEIIAYSPGVSMQQGNGPRDVVISIRGSNTRSTFGIRGVQVFDDGFTVTQPDGLSRSDLIDPHVYGSLDVERGPSSSLYGNYAAEGAINFKTRRPEDINGVEGGFDFGSFGYGNAYVTVGHQSKNFGIMAFGSEVFGDGFTGHTSYNTFTANVLATFTPSSKDKFTFKFIDNEMNPNLSIRLSTNQYALNPYQQGCETLAAPGCASLSLFVNGSTGTKVNVSADQAGSKRDDRRTIMGTRWEHSLNERTTWRNQLVFDSKDIKQPTGATSAVGVTPSFNLLSDITQRGTLFGRSAVHFVGLSANYENTNSMSYNVVPGGDATLGALVSASYGHAANYGVRAREEVNITSTITGTVGVGVERSELQGRNNVYTYSATAAPTIARTDALRKFTNVAPEATVVFQPNRTIRAQARVGTAYSTPQASNLFVTPAGVSGNNTDVKPQSNIGIDSGVDVTKGLLSASLAGYYEWYRDELLTQSPGVNLLSYTFNAPRAIHKGVETTLEARMPGRTLSGLRLRGNYTWMDEVYTEYTERLSAGAFTQEFNRAGNKIPGITPHSVTARLAYERTTGILAGLGGYVEHSFRDKFWLDNANLLQAPGYGVTNINIHYEGRRSTGDLKALRILFEVRNITDRTWVASASNLSNSLSSTTGQQNDASVLANAGSIYAGTPRAYVVSVRHVF